MIGDDYSGDETDNRHRFDGPSQRFANVDRTGYGDMALGILRLDEAIRAVEQDDVLKQAEEALEQWLRQRESGSE